MKRSHFLAQFFLVFHVQCHSFCSKSIAPEKLLNLYYQIGVTHRIKVTVDESPKINKTNSFNSN